jgi:hypothetical protein
MPSTPSETRALPLQAGQGSGHGVEVLHPVVILAAALYGVLCFERLRISGTLTRAGGCASVMAFGNEGAQCRRQ